MNASRVKKQLPWWAAGATLIFGGAGSYVAGVNPVTLFTAPQKILEKVGSLDARLDDFERRMDRRLDDIEDRCRERRHSRDRDR